MKPTFLAAFIALISCTPAIAQNSKKAIIENRIKYCRLVIDQDVIRGRWIAGAYSELLRLHNIQVPQRKPYTDAELNQLGNDKPLYMALQKEETANSNEEQKMSDLIKGYHAQLR